MKKLVSIILIIACLFTLFTGYKGIKDVMTAKEEGTKNKQETLATLDKLKAGVATLEENRKAYEDGKKAYEDGTKQYEAGLKTLADGKVALADGKAKLAAGQKEYDAGKAELDSKTAAYNEGVAALANPKRVVDQKTSEFILNNPEKVDALVKQNMPTGIDKAADLALSQVPAKAAAGDATYVMLNTIMNAKGTGNDIAKALVEQQMSDPQTLAMVEAGAKAKVRQQVAAEIEKLIQAKDPDTMAAIDAAITAGAKDYVANVDKLLENDPDNEQAQKIAAAKKAYGEEAAVQAVKQATYNNEEQMAAIKEKAIDQKTSEYFEANKDAIMAQAKATAVADYMEKLPAAAQQGDEKAQMLYAISTSTKDGKGIAKDLIKANIVKDKDVMAQVEKQVRDGVKDGIRAEVEKQVNETLEGVKPQLAQYEAGKAKLEAGKATLDKGYAELAEKAPQLDKGAQDLKDAEKQLADGKAKLDEFEAGQAQVDAGYEQLMQNEAIAAKVKEKGMDALDAAYEVVDDQTAAATKDLTNRAVYNGIAIVAAVIGLITGIVGLTGKPAKVGAVITAVVAIVACIWGATNSFSEHALQMWGIIAITAVAVIAAIVLPKKAKVTK